MKSNGPKILRHVGLIVLGMWLIAGLEGHAQQSLPTAERGIWEGEVGNGVKAGADSLTLEAGAQYGFSGFGGVESHHIALVSLSYGHMLSGVVGEGHWYSGNFEGRLELFGGWQFSPDEDWIVGFTPHLRYDFATGTRWVPFFDIGAGVTATGIGPPDLSGTFEFNLQAGIGVHWLITDNLAITAEARYMHVSCAGIHHPNLGMNGIVGLIGITRFF